MKKYVLPALTANAAGLGIHWIYDHDYLKELSKKQSLLFMKQEKEHFDKARPSFYVYPDAEVGDVSVQGEILKWLFKALKENPEFTSKEYEKMLYNKFKPGGDYTGYVESYGKEQVFNHLLKELRQDADSIKPMDHQLVGFVPYLVAKELDLSNELAFEFTKVYSEDPIFLEFFKFFDKLLAKLADNKMKEAISLVIEETPNAFKEVFKKAIDIKDTNKFVEKYAGRACPIKHALPVIIHLLYHTNSYEEAIYESALIGGAVSDRNMLLGVMWAQVSEVPKEWIEKVNI
ncbi:MAG: ADP-ribosylglycohydrolase family protein [Candidatus Izimaplasma sp.]|nr:ADP-ribosylglycohydrolase family protein [Candidatus Izimaplasma bacterium]